MQSKSKRVIKIKDYYVGDDCVQIMLPYKNALTLINQEGILFHNNQDSHLYINKYLEDERKEQFPYSNIPIHYKSKGINKITYTNQLLDFEKPYIRITDGFISQYFAIKDNNQAFLINSRMPSYGHTEYMTYDKLLEYVYKQNSLEEKIYYVYLDGTIPANDMYPTEEDIYDYIKRELKSEIRDFINSEIHYNGSTITSRYLLKNPWFLDYSEESIKNIDFSLIDFNVPIGNNSPLVIIRINNGNIKIESIDVLFVRQNNFKVTIREIPVAKYTLEQLKYSPNIKVAKEPRISLRLNPNITKQDIKEAEQKKRSLNMKKRNLSR